MVVIDRFVDMVDSRISIRELGQWLGGWFGVGRMGLWTKVMGVLVSLGGREMGWRCSWMMWVFASFLDFGLLG